MSEIERTKAALRSALRKKRAQLDQAQKRAASAAAARHVAALIDGAKTPIVAVFWPLKGEIDTAPAIAALRAAGARIALPRMKGPDLPLEFRRHDQGDPLVEAAFGCMEPAASAERLRPDLIIAPLLGFDRTGGRLGYGGGFYDRSLEELRADGRPLRVYGLAFARQEVDAVPRGPHDATLDGIVTEEGLIRPDQE